MSHRDAEELAAFRRGLSERKLVSLSRTVSTSLDLVAHFDGVPPDFLLDRAVRQYVKMRTSKPGMRAKLREFFGEGEFDDGP